MTAGLELLEALGAAVYATDAEGRITFHNGAAAQLWGREPGADARWCGSLRLFQPDGRELRHDQSPMALALNQRRAIRGAELVAERPDGDRISFLAFASPLFDASGSLIGGVNLLVDLATNQEVGEERARLAAIVASSDDAIVSKTLQGRVTSWNAAAARIFGYAADEMIGESITRIIPPELRGEEADILERLSKGERIEHYETVRVAKDGRRIDISLTVSPLRDKTGVVIGASKVGRDITERKRAEEVQRLLLSELNHRVKNTLAMVDALARQTMRRAPSPASFVESFSGRLRSLARAHRLLTDTAFRGAPISQLIRDQLMLGDRSDSRISWSGPDVTLDSQSALHLALVLHELGANARKHGALSSATGAVEIAWLVESNAQRTLRLAWRESGGPRVSVDRPQGFGTTLIEQSLKPHGGQVVMEFAEFGVACTITLPLSERPDALASIAGAARPTTAPAASPAAALQANRPVLASRRILIVEDEVLIAMVVTDYLTEAGCEVVGPAATVQAALRLIEAGVVDAALLDANIAGQRIDEVALALTRNGTPFAFVTGYGRDALPPPFQEAIMIEKPFSQMQLLDALEQLLTPSGDGVTRIGKRK